METTRLRRPQNRYLGGAQHEGAANYLQTKFDSGATGFLADFEKRILVQVEFHLCF